MCNYSDAYIFVKGRISATDSNNDNRRNKKLTFTNKAPFILCIAKIINPLIDSREGLDNFMSTCTLL